MRTMLRLAFWMLLLAFGAVALIKIIYDVSWDEAVAIADQFAEDLLA